MPDSENISRHEDITSTSEDVFPHEETLPTEDSNFQETEGVGKDDSYHKSQDSTPPSQSPATGPEQPRSPPASISGPGHSPVHNPNNTITDATHNSHEDFSTADEPSSGSSLYDLSKAHEVKVVYQSVEYKLFSSSDSDDPDSFFLSDLAIMKQPLIEFFKAIREIIRDDLSAEDELCISIEDEPTSISYIPGSTFQFPDPVS